MYFKNNIKIRIFFPLKVRFVQYLDIDLFLADKFYVLVGRESYMSVIRYEVFQVYKRLKYCGKAQFTVHNSVHK